MKKQMISILLVIAMLCCFMPAAFAEESESHVWIMAESRLLDMNYGDMDERTLLAVGDTLEVWYMDSVTADVYIDGEKVYTLKADENEIYGYPLTQTGTVEIAVRRGDDTLAERTFTVISSEDMYSYVIKDAVRETFDTVKNTNPFPSKEVLEDAANNGFPVGNPFLPVAFFTLLITNLFHALFSFIRIVR